MSSVDALQGACVLVTRPQGQAENLCELIDRAGGKAVAFPALRIEPLEAPTPGAGTAYDVVIFVSPNAVKFGLALLRELKEKANPPLVGAIGPTTAAALTRARHAVDINPGSGFTSEALLSAPQLKRMTGKKALIVRGRGGREHLARELRRRGAAVNYAEVYKRVKPEPNQDIICSLESRWKEGGIDIVAANSVETLENLYEILTIAGRRCLRRTPLVTASQRVADRARELGLEAGVWIAAAPDDQGILEAICAWKATSPDSETND